MDDATSTLQQKEILLYLFLVLASDRYGISFYSYDTVCNLLQMDLDQYTNARNGLIDKDLIAFDGTIFQVLDLPARPVSSTVQRQTSPTAKMNQVAIARLIEQSVKPM